MFLAATAAESCGLEGNLTTDFALIRQPLSFYIGQLLSILSLNQSQLRLRSGCDTVANSKPSFDHARPEEHHMGRDMLAVGS